MSVREFHVKLTPREAMYIIKQSVTSGSVTGTLIDSYARKLGEHEIFVFILEKYYMRSSNRASLTVTIDNFEEQTKVHAVAAGAGEGVFFRFDWGASRSFAASVETALRPYIVEVE